MIFVRNVKFSAAECNSFNMRKKFTIYLAFKQISGGSGVKKQPSRSKVTTIVMQSYILRNAIPNFFNFNLAYLPTINASLLTKRQSLRNCIIIQFECIFMQNLRLSRGKNVKIQTLLLYFIHKNIFIITAHFNE